MHRYIAHAMLHVWPPLQAGRSSATVSDDGCAMRLIRGRARSACHGTCMRQQHTLLVLQATATASARDLQTAISSVISSSSGNASFTGERFHIS